MCGPSRRTLFVAARHVFCHHAAEKGFTKSGIGRMINRSHSAVCHGINVFNSQIGHFPAMDRINGTVKKELQRAENGTKS
jgi:hypothetical protein